MNPRVYPQLLYFHTDPRDSKFYAISIPPIDEIFDSPNVPLYRYECFELAIDAINSHESITHAIGY